MAVDFNGIDIEGLRKGLRPDENIQLVLKRHWIVFVYTGLYALLLIVSTFILLMYRTSVFSLF